MLSLEDLHANGVHQLEQCHLFSALSFYCSLWIKNGRTVKRIWQYSDPTSRGLLFEGLIVQNGKIGVRQ